MLFSRPHFFRSLTTVLRVCCYLLGSNVHVAQVLAKANKRRMEELHRQQSMAKRIGTAEVDPPKKFVVEVPKCTTSAVELYRGATVLLLISTRY